MEGLGGTSRSSLHNVRQAADLTFYVDISASRKAVRAPRSNQSPRPKLQY
jgi:hypothetical protein